MSVPVERIREVIVDFKWRKTLCTSNDSIHIYDYVIDELQKVVDEVGENDSSGIPGNNAKETEQIPSAKDGR